MTPTRTFTPIWPGQLLMLLVGFNTTPINWFTRWPALQHIDNKILTGRAYKIYMLIFEKRFAYKISALLFFPFWLSALALLQEQIIQALVICSILFLQPPTGSFLALLNSKWLQKIGYVLVYKENGRKENG